MIEKDTVIAVISDMQVGSTVALCPPKWNLYDGGTHTASPGQKILYRKWIDSAKNVKDMLTETRQRKRLVIVLNGEPIDGHHHDTSQVITKTPNEQMEMASALIDEWMQITEYEPRQDDCMYLVRGTSAHERGDHIERLGRDLDGVVPYRKDSSSTTKDGRYYHEKLLKIANGVEFDITHHGFGRGSRSHTRSNSIYYTVKSIYFDALDYGYNIPDYVIRSHNHVYTYDNYPGERKIVHGILTPCWQLKTHFVNRVAGNDRINTIGNVYFDITKEGHAKLIPDYIKIPDTKATEF